MPPKNQVLRLLGGAALLIIGGLLIGIFRAGCPIKRSRADQVCFEKQCINVEVVQKEEDLRRGLQLREFLDPQSGMLFIFAQSRRHSFWMKDTWIPLDMIWMDYGRRIVHVEHDVPPCRKDPCPTYTPSQEALYVLEVNAGYSQELGLELGDRAEFRFRETKP